VCGCVHLRYLCVRAWRGVCESLSMYTGVYTLLSHCCYTLVTLLFTVVGLTLHERHMEVADSDGVSAL
jgi:hypothetical protein